MRAVIALFQHETNTFSTLPTPLSAFSSGIGLDSPPTGDLALEHYGTAGFAFSGLINVAKEHNVKISIPIAAYAEPSGKVIDDAFEYIAGSICDDVRKGCDAVLLDLHGAMVTESYFDGEGELLKRIRQIDPKVPIAVALDFHTNLTREIASNCTVIDGYRTYPHIDMYETGQRAAQTLFHIIKNNIETQISWACVPMMTHMIKQTPLAQPMKDIMNLAISSVDDSKVFNSSVFGGFPLADIPHVSLSALTVEQIGNEEGSKVVNKICEMAWQRRSEFVFDPEELTDTISNVNNLTEFPVVIADHGDNSGAGGSSDDLTVLDEMLRQGLSDIVAGPVWDPEVVEKLIVLGEGSKVSIEVGGNTDVASIDQKGKGITLSGHVAKITNGRFKLEGPMQTGLIVNIGRSVVLKTNELELLISEERWEPYDPACFTHAGIDPFKKKYILLKSRQHFKAGFESLSKHIVLAAGPGVCSSDYSQFRFKNLSRPIFPLDDIDESHFYYTHKVHVT